MGISEFNRIDTLVSLKSGSLRLLIVDPGNLVDEDRLYALKRKLKFYQTALQVESFRAEHSGWQNTEIIVQFAAEPTESMRKISAISFEAAGKKFKVPVTFEYLEPSFGISGEKFHLVEVNYNYKALSDRVIEYAKDLIKIELFTPFGMSWSDAGKYKMIDVSFNPGDEQIPAVKKSLQKETATDETVQTVALACDVLAIHPDQTEKSDAIAIDLEHRQGSPITMFVHYQRNGEAVETLKPYFGTKDVEFFAAGSDEDIVAAEVIDESADGAGMSDEEHQSWLESMPTICFLLVSAIDGSIDKKETLAFGKSIEQYAQHSNPLVQQVFSAAAGQLEKDMTELMGLGASGALIMPMRLRVGRQTALEKAPEHAEELFRILIDMSTTIASASGGFLGVGSKISKEEKAALAIITSMLASQAEGS